jgi:hypothetical protein
MTWTEKHKETLSSNGKLVNFGNSNANGANVNRNHPRNSNSNLQRFFFRSLAPVNFCGAFLCHFLYFFKSFVNPST